MSRATQHTEYSRPALLDPFFVLLCALGGWSLQSLRSLSLSDGSAPGGTCKARRKERLAYLWGVTLAEGVRPAFLSPGLSPKATALTKS